MHRKNKKTRQIPQTTLGNSIRHTAGVRGADAGQHCEYDQEGEEKGAHSSKHLICFPGLAAPSYREHTDNATSKSTNKTCKERRSVEQAARKERMVPGHISSSLLFFSFSDPSEEAQLQISPTRLLIDPFWPIFLPCNRPVSIHLAGPCGGFFGCFAATPSGRLASARA